MLNPHTHKIVGVRPDGPQTINVLFQDRSGSSNRSSIAVDSDATNLIHARSDLPVTDLLQGAWSFSECTLSVHDPDQQQYRVCLIRMLEHFLQAVDPPAAIPHIEDKLGEPYQRRGHSFAAGANWVHGQWGIRPCFLWREMEDGRMLATVVMGNGPESAQLFWVTGDYLWNG